MATHCPECGASTNEYDTCQSNFHALLYRENALYQVDSGLLDSSDGKIAHFYAVSCYAIQHPDSMGYTVGALLGARANLAAHLDGAVTLAMIIAKIRATDKGSQKTLRRAGDPIHCWHVSKWSLTAVDVLATDATPEAYFDATTRWAKATLDDIDKASPNHG